MKRLVSAGMLLAATVPAFADGKRFAAAVEEYTSDDHRAWVIDHLMKFELGAKCWAKVDDPKSGAVEAASYATSDVVDYAKANGGGDWEALEQDKRKLGASMDAFRARFFLTVTVEGDDCDARREALWIRYWTATTKAIAEHPPAGGKVFVTLDVSAKYKDVAVEVAADGATVTIRAPRDKEPRSWDRIEQTFTKLQEGVSTKAGGIDAFAFAAKKHSNNEYAGLIISQLHAFKIGSKCMAKLADPDQSAVYATGFVTTAIREWAMRSGAEDWEDITSRAESRASARETIAADIAELRKRFSVTVIVDGDDCDTSPTSGWLAYWKETMSTLQGLPPKSKKVAITITGTAKAKAVTVAVGKDGSTFAVTGPANAAPRDYREKIEAAFTTVTSDKQAVAARAQNKADSKLAKAGGNPFPFHGVPLGEAKAKGVPDYERGTTYTKGAEVATQMSSNPHTLVFRCLETKCTDSPGTSRQWKSVGWARAD